MGSRTNGKPAPRKWTAQKVADALRAFYQPGGKAPAARRPVLERDNPPLMWAARRHFGSLEAAMEAAGLPYPPNPRWDKASILQALRTMHAEGRDLSMSAVRDRKGVFRPAINRFGSWRKAVEAAGIPYATVARERDWSRDNVLAALRERHATGADMGGGAVQKREVSLWAAARRHFGSYSAALESAGIQLPPAAGPWSWTARRLGEELRRLHGQGVDLSSGAVRKTHRELYEASCYRLGGWPKAVESAGLEYDSVRRERTWSKEAILLRLRRLHEEGADLRAVAVKKADVPLFAAVQRYFGTMRRAVAAAGLVYPGAGSDRSPGHFTGERVLQSLQEMHEQGLDLRYRTMKQRGQALFYAAKKHFGSYTNAVAQAGINYWHMSQEQLRLEREARRELGEAAE